MFCFCSQNAEKSVRFYKSISERNENSGKILNLEMDKLKAIIADAQQQSVNESQASLKWSDFTTKAARKAIIIGIVLVVICILNGVTTYYTAEIFEETGSTLSSNLSAIITGIVPVIAVGICMYLVDRVGRKVREYLQFLDHISINRIIYLRKFNYDLLRFSH